MESDLEESNLKIPKGFMEGMIRLSGGAGQTSSSQSDFKIKDEFDYSESDFQT